MAATACCPSFLISYIAQLFSIFAQADSEIARFRPPASTESGVAQPNSKLCAIAFFPVATGLKMAQS